MGHNGAILASAAGPLFLPAAPIEAKSAAGAGDSFLSAMLFAISIGWEMGDAFRFGIAARAAAVMSPGHDLARPNDTDRHSHRTSQLSSAVLRPVYTPQLTGRCETSITDSLFEPTSVT